MSESSPNQEISNEELFGLPLPWTGALLGILTVILVGSLLWDAGYKYRAFAFLYPGYLVLSTLGYYLPSSFEYLLMLGISSIPPAIIGSMIISRNNKLKILGFVFLVIYFVLWFIASIGFFIAFDG